MPARRETRCVHIERDSRPCPISDRTTRHPPERPSDASSHTRRLPPAARGRSQSFRPDKVRMDRVGKTGPALPLFGPRSRRSPADGRGGYRDRLPWIPAPCSMPAEVGEMTTISGSPMIGDLRPEISWIPLPVRVPSSTPPDTSSVGIPQSILNDVDSEKTDRGRIYRPGRPRRTLAEPADPISAECRSAER